MPDLAAYREACVLNEGTPATVRAIRRDDWPSVLDAFKNADRGSIYTRFFTYKKSLSDTELSEITDVDFDRIVALVVTTEVDGREALIGGGRYVRSDHVRDDQTAEIAFMTHSDYRGRGVARTVLTHLARIAAQRGLRQFEAVVLPENSAMLSSFRGCGFPVAMAMEDGVIRVRIPLSGVS